MWKQPFVPFLTQPGPTSWPQKAQVRNFLNSILVKKHRNSIIINLWLLQLTNLSDIIENNHFFLWHFWPKSGKNVTPTSFKCGISSYIYLKLPLKCLYNHKFVFLKVFPMQIMEKNSIDIDIFCSQNLDLILPKFFPKTTSNLFCWFPMKCVGDLINIDSLIAIQQFWKKIGKTSKNYHFWAQLAPKKGYYEPRPKQKIFFYRNKRDESYLSTVPILHRNTKEAIISHSFIQKPSVPCIHIYHGMEWLLCYTIIAVQKKLPAMVSLPVYSYTYRSENKIFWKFLKLH